MRFYFKVQMQANATLHMFKNNPSLDVYIGTKLFSSSEDIICVKIVKDILYVFNEVFSKFKSGPYNRNFKSVPAMLGWF